RFFRDDLGRHLPEIPQHREGKPVHLDLAAELRLESPERDRVLRVEVGEAIYLDCRRSAAVRACRTVPHTGRRVCSEESYLRGTTGRRRHAAARRPAWRIWFRADARLGDWDSSCGRVQA